MFNIKNVKPQTILIVGVVSSVVLVGIVIFVVFKESKKSSQISSTPPIRPLPTGREEVYLQILDGGMRVKKGQFNSLKATIFSNNPNITLATIQQIRNSLANGLKVCDAGLALDDMGMEIIANVTPGYGAMTSMTMVQQACVGSQEIITDRPDAFGIWIYGVKPPNGTPNVKRFSTEKWSQYYSL